MATVTLNGIESLRGDVKGQNGSTSLVYTVTDATDVSDAISAAETASPTFLQQNPFLTRHPAVIERRLNSSSYSVRVPYRSVFSTFSQNQNANLPLSGQKIETMTFNRAALPVPVIKVIRGKVDGDPDTAWVEYAQSDASMGVTESVLEITISLGAWTPGSQNTIDNEVGRLHTINGEKRWLFDGAVVRRAGESAVVLSYTWRGRRGQVGRQATGEWAANTSETIDTFALSNAAHKYIPLPHLDPWETWLAIDGEADPDDLQAAAPTVIVNNRFPDGSASNLPGIGSL